MSEEIDLAVRALELLKKKGKTEIQVSKLPRSLKRIATGAGYTDDDSIPIPKLEEYLQSAQGIYSSNPQFLNIPQEAEGTLNSTSSIPQDSSSVEECSEENNVDLIQQITPYLHAISRVIDEINKGPNKTERKLAVYLLLKNKEMLDPDLRRELAPLGQVFSRNREPYKVKTINNVISFVRNSPHIWSSKDPTTGMFIYRLKEETAERILQEYELLRKAEEFEREQEELRRADREGLVRAFVEFFSGYKEEGKAVFVERLKDLLVLEDDHVLRVDWHVFASVNPELADRLLDEPDVVISAADEAVGIVFKEELFVDKPPRVHVAFVNLPWSLSPRKLRSEHVGKLVQVRGVVSAIAEGERTNGVKGFIERAVFVCRRCGAEVELVQKPYENFVVAKSCPECGAREMELSIERSKILDMREIFVQDPSDALHAAGMASYVRVILLEDNARMDVNPGDEVLITGVVRGIVRKKNGKPALGWVLEANSLTKLTKDIEDLEITPSDVEKFRSMVQDPEFDSKLVHSLAPAITGREVEKKAVLLALFSGEDYDLEGTHVRKRSHVLLFGDAGTGKSEIIRHAAQIAPGGVHSTGTHSSGVGLTAAIDTMDGVRVLRAGVLVLADRGVAALDELDKMKEDEYDKMLDALEQGWFPYNKAGFNTRLMARAVVIAAANPPGGEFDRHNYKPFDELKRLFDQPFYSRFDLIMPVFKDEDEETLGEIAEAVLGKHTGEVKPPYESETLTKFIAYARKNIPRVGLPLPLRDVMKKYMIELAKTMGSAAPRAMEAIIRLTEAHARMHLREEATLADFLAAKELFDEMITRLAGSSDEEEKEEVMKGLAGVIWTEEKKRKVEKLWSILRYYEALDEEGAHVNDVVEEAEQQGIEKSEVLLLLEDMERANMVEQPKPGFYRLRRRGS